MWTLFVLAVWVIFTDLLLPLNQQQLVLLMFMGLLFTSTFAQNAKLGVFIALSFTCILNRAWAFTSLATQGAWWKASTWPGQSVSRVAVLEECRVVLEVMVMPHATPQSLTRTPLRVPSESLVDWKRRSPCFHRSAHYCLFSTAPATCVGRVFA